MSAADGQGLFGGAEPGEDPVWAGWESWACSQWAMGTMSPAPSAYFSFTGEWNRLAQCSHSRTFTNIPGSQALVAHGGQELE